MKDLGVGGRGGGVCPCPGVGGDLPSFPLGCRWLDTARWAGWEGEGSRQRDRKVCTETGGRGASQVAQRGAPAGPS